MCMQFIEGAVEIKLHRKQCPICEELIPNKDFVSHTESCKGKKKII